MKQIKLSICIPTFNRAFFLDQALNSVVSQINENIEVVIVDGASTDATAEVIGKYKKEISNLVYYCGERKMGIDRDMAKTVSLSRGEYCWLLSDDDRLKPGAIQRILKEIEDGHEIYLCNTTECTFTMKPIGNRFWLSRSTPDKVFYLHKKNEFIEYCNKANSIGALFSYMSVIIFRREEWNKSGYNYNFDGTAYAHVSTLLSFIRRKCVLKYIRAPLVLLRRGNVSFHNKNGLVKRVLLDFDGYLMLANTYLADDRQAKEAFLKVMTREHPWYTIVHMMSFIDNPNAWESFKNKMFKCGYNPKMIKICYVLSGFKGLISFAVKLKRKIVNDLWANKFICLCR